jgi:hypothetical protein
MSNTVFSEENVLFNKKLEDCMDSVVSSYARICKTVLIENLTIVELLGSINFPKICIDYYEKSVLPHLR